eukprot:1309935-Rhodomonas_salina.3
MALVGRRYTCTLACKGPGYTCTPAGTRVHVHRRPLARTQVPRLLLVVRDRGWKSIGGDRS